MFLNPLMLAGIGAAVIPLVLHLLAKSRYRTVEWGAMMFLQSAGTNRRPTWRFRQLAILMLRMAIIALLAVALARPVFAPSSQPQMMPGNSSTVLILDCSMSMTTDEGGKTRFDLAREVVLQQLAAMHSGDEVALLTPGLPGRFAIAAFTADLQDVATHVIDLRAGSGPAVLSDSLTTALNLLEASEMTTRRIVVITDRQAQSWTGIDDSFANRWQAQAQRLAVVPHLSIIPVGSNTDVNVAVEEPRSVPAVVVRAIPFQFQFTIRNYGPEVQRDLPVVVSENDTVLYQGTTTLAGNSHVDLSIPLIFRNPGQHVLSVATKSLSMSADDQREYVVNVSDKIPVLLISDEPSQRGNLLSADLLRCAMAPFETSRTEGADVAAVDTASLGQLGTYNLGRYAVVVLSGADRLDADEVRSLEAFVYGGGGLIYLPSDHTDPEHLDSDLFQSTQGLLPAAIERVMQSENVLTKLSENSAGLIGHYSAGTQLLSSPVKLTRWLQLRPVESSRVLMTFVDGNAFIVEGDFGRGHVLQLAANYRSECGTLGESAVFPLLIQSIIQRAARGTFPPGNLQLGDPLQVQLPGPVLPRSVFVITPDGRRVQPRVSPASTGDLSRSDVALPSLDSPGKYILSRRLREGLSNQYFVVAPSAAESDPTAMTKEQWAAVLARLHAQLRDSAAMNLQSVRQPERARELWSVMLAGVLGLSCVELLLARMWSKEKS